MRTFVIACGVTSLVVSGSAFAQVPRPAPSTTPPASAPLSGPAPSSGSHRHDGGYFRGIVGPAYVYLSVDDVDYTVKGPGFVLGIAGGYVVAKNLILCAEAFGDIALNPGVDEFGRSRNTRGTKAGNVGLGAGLVYYIMPANVFVSATLAASQIRMSGASRSDGGGTETSNWGPSVSLMLGKEWWVADDWGLGVAGQIFVSKLADSLDGPGWTVVSGGVAFSATYN